MRYIHEVVADNDIDGQERANIVAGISQYNNFGVGFGSPHPGTFNVVLGDGSLKAVNLGVDDQNVWWSLALRDDGVPFDQDEL